MTRRADRSGNPISNMSQQLSPGDARKGDVQRVGQALDRMAVKYEFGNSCRKSFMQRVPQCPQFLRRERQVFLR